MPRRSRGERGLAPLQVSREVQDVQPIATLAAPADVHDHGATGGPITVHHGALAHLLGINALRASEAAAVRSEDYAETMRGQRVLHLVGKGDKPATMPLTIPVLLVREACRG